MGWGDAQRSQDWEDDPAFVDARLRQGGVHLDAVFSNGLERARQTAMYFVKRRGILLIHDAVEPNEVYYGTLFRKRFLQNA